MRLFIVALAGLGGSLGATTTLACTCAATTIADQARATTMVAVGDVLDDRAVAGEHIARVRVVEALRGVEPGAEFDVRWIPPDGKSCFFVSLHPGRWLLFLAQNPDGTLSTLPCDANSAVLGSARSERALTAVRDALAPGSPQDKAVFRAIPIANQALDRAYARKAGEAHPSRREPWVSAGGATIRTVASGWRVRWMHDRPSGFTYEVEVEVPPTGAPRVLKATATYSPD
jgi:hypothetical protein